MFKAFRIHILVIFFETEFNKKPGDPIRERRAVCDFVSKINFVNGTSTLSLLILRMDLGLMKIPPTFFMIQERGHIIAFSRRHIFTWWIRRDSNWGCASMRSSSAIFQKWFFMTAHPYISVFGHRQSLWTRIHNELFLRVIFLGESIRRWQERSWRWYEGSRNFRVSEMIKSSLKTQPKIS